MQVVHVEYSGRPNYLECPNSFEGGSYMSIRKLRPLAALLLIAALLTACTQTAPPPAATKQLTKVSIGQSQDILAFAPLYVARAKGYFEEEGIDLTMEILAGGSQVMSALSGDSIQFAAMSAPDLLKAVASKQELLAIQSMIYQTMNIVVSKKFADERKVTRDTPIEQRVQALKGAIIGTTGPGAASETFPKWLVAKYGNMDPNKDLETIGIGGLPARQASLKSGQIDAYVSSGPGPEEAEAQGFGYVLFPASHVPGSGNMLHEIMFGKKEYIEKNPEVAKAVARAVTRGGQFLVENPEEGRKLVATFFSKVQPAVLEMAMDNILPQVVNDGAFKDGQWQFLVDYLLAIKSIKPEQVPDLKEGVFWTNKHVK
jgi:NitT/TauT family transport system substrate-binding protein